MHTIFLALLFLASFTPIAEGNLQIRGKCILPEINRRERVIELFVKAGGTMIAHTRSNKTDGSYAIELQTGTATRLEFFCVDPWQPADTLYLGSVTGLDKASVIRDFFPWQRHVDDDNHVVCPRCGRSDDVEDPPPGKKSYYCNRDQVRF